MPLNTLEASFLNGMPKVDLHCHLNVSVSAALLAHLEVLAQQAAEEVNGSSNQKTEAENTFPCNSVAVSDNNTSLRNRTDAIEDYFDPADRMKYCFGVFDAIYKIMTNAAFTRLGVQDLLLHSAAEQIFLLEMRTSLRGGLYRTARAAACRNKRESLTKKAYVETVTATVEHLLRGGVVDFETGDLVPRDVPLPPAWMNHFFANCTPQALMEYIHLMSSMHVRLLLSINRGHGAADAAEGVSLAKQLQSEQVKHFVDALPEETVPVSTLRDDARRVCWVTGVDFSGNCYKNRFVDFLPALKEARQSQSLGITLHAGEKDDPAELVELIDFAPERWGHLVFTDPSALATIAQRHDAIELCITNNAITSGYSEIARHHLGDIIAAAVAETGADVTVSYSLLALLADGATAAAAMQCRLQRRMSRWHKTTEPLGHVCIATPLPNVSFHTDDRGVLATSIRKEIQRLLLHPACDAADVATQMQSMRALQRLAIPHAFEIPHEIVLLCTRGWNVRAGAAGLTAEVMSMRTEERAELSRVECQWLIEEFSPNSVALS